MKNLTHLFAALLAMAALSACTTAATAPAGKPAPQATIPANGVHAQSESEAHAIAQKNQFKNWETYRKSPVALWTGMPRTQFEAAVHTEADGYSVIKLGDRDYVVGATSFDNDDKLRTVVLAYAGRSANDVRQAYEAYIKATGPVDFHTDPIVNSSSQDSPDAESDASWWYGPTGGTSILRAFSGVTAKQLSSQLGMPVPAGEVLIVVDKR